MKEMFRITKRIYGVNFLTPFISKVILKSFELPKGLVEEIFKFLLYARLFQNDEKGLRITKGSVEFTAYLCKLGRFKVTKKCLEKQKRYME